MGFNSLLHEVIKEDDQPAASTDNGDNSDSGTDRTVNNNDSDEDYDRKSENAVDYSDINELAEDLQTLMKPPEQKTSGDDYDDIEDAIPVNKVTADASVQELRVTMAATNNNSDSGKLVVYKLSSKKV